MFNPIRFFTKPKPRAEVHLSQSKMVAKINRRVRRELISNGLNPIYLTDDIMHTALVGLHDCWAEDVTDTTPEKLFWMDALSSEIERLEEILSVDPDEDFQTLRDINRIRSWSKNL